jgi:hypothetical protein
MKRLIVLIFFPAITFCATAQSDSARSGNNITDVPASIRIASNSSLIYPGAAFGLDYPVQYIQVTKYVKNGSVIKSTKQRFVSVTLGYYHHTGFHDNFYILPEWVMRKT